MLDKRFEVVENSDLYMISFEDVVSNCQVLRVKIDVFYAQRARKYARFPDDQLFFCRCTAGFSALQKTQKEQNNAYAPLNTEITSQNTILDHSRNNRRHIFRPGTGKRGRRKMFPPIIQNGVRPKTVATASFSVFDENISK